MIQRHCCISRISYGDNNLGTFGNTLWCHIAHPRRLQSRRVRLQDAPAEASGRVPSVCLFCCFPSSLNPGRQELLAVKPSLDFF